MLQPVHGFGVALKSDGERIRATNSVAVLTPNRAEGGSLKSDVKGFFEGEGD